MNRIEEAAEEMRSQEALPLSEGSHRQQVEILEQRVRQRTAELEAANRELEALTYSVSHDLRTPARCIVALTDLLVRDCGDQLNERARGHLARVRSETQRMGDLISDLLKLSKVAQATVTPSLVDLTAMAEGIGTRLQEEHRERQIKFVIQPGLQARCDAELMETALSNLMGNACKFSSTRTLACIEFGQAEAADEKAFFVRDNGVGFNMKYAQRLFGVFQRMQSEFPGTGIGLALVQRIVRRFGGRVWAEAEENQGATFYFTLKATE